MSELEDAPSLETLRKSLLVIAVESWRCGRIFDRILRRLDAGEQRRYQGHFRWFQRKLQDSLANAGMRIESVEGQAYDPGMAVTALNIEEFAPTDELVVDQMIEPIVMGPQDVLIRSGTVMLRKVVL